jgi:hypothetical protein
MKTLRQPAIACRLVALVAVEGKRARRVIAGAMPHRPAVAMGGGAPDRSGGGYRSWRDTSM